MLVRVQVPLRVQKKSESESESEHSHLFFFTLALTLTLCDGGCNFFFEEHEFFGRVAAIDRSKSTSFFSSVYPRTSRILRMIRIESVMIKFYNGSFMASQLPFYDL